MSPVKHLDPDDLPLYAMQLLPVEDMEEMREHLQHSGEARRVLSEVYGDLALFGQTVEMQSPPAQAKQRLMKQTAREKKVIPFGPTKTGAFTASAGSALSNDAPRKTGAASTVLPWVGWALAAGMVLPVVNFYRQREQLQDAIAVNRTQLLQTQASLQQTQVSAELANTVMQTVKDPNAVHVTLTGLEQKPPPQGRASYVAEKGALVFLASNLVPVKPTQTYELWLIPANGQVPIPAGTFRPDAQGNASLVMPQLPKGVTAKAFGVTLEEGEGSATPTLPILLKGAAS